MDFKIDRGVPIPPPIRQSGETDKRTGAESGDPECMQEEDTAGNPGESCETAPLGSDLVGANPASVTIPDREDESPKSKESVSSFPIGKKTLSEEKRLNRAHYSAQCAWQWVRSIKEYADLPELTQAMQLIASAKKQIEAMQKSVVPDPEPEPIPVDEDPVED